MAWRCLGQCMAGGTDVGDLNDEVGVDGDSFRALEWALGGH